MSDSDNKVSYCRIPPRIVEQYGDKFPFEIFIKLKSGKAIRLSNKDENVKDIFEKYTAKGVDSIFVAKDDFSKFMKAFRQKNKNKLFDPSTINEKNVDALSDAHKVVSECL